MSGLALQVERKAVESWEMGQPAAAQRGLQATSSLGARGSIATWSDEHESGSSMSDVQVSFLICVLSGM